MKQWYLVIDVRWCHDCNNCFMSCKDEHVDNEWPGYTNAQPRHGHRWMNIQRRERGHFFQRFLSEIFFPVYNCFSHKCILKWNNNIEHDGIQ